MRTTPCRIWPRFHPHSPVNQWTVYRHGQTNWNWWKRWQEDGPGDSIPCTLQARHHASAGQASLVLNGMPTRQECRTLSKLRILGNACVAPSPSWLVDRPATGTIRLPAVAARAGLGAWPKFTYRKKQTLALKQSFVFVHYILVTHVHRHWTK